MARLRAFGSKARGSVGATTYYVVNGQQIAREKSVEVKNPKTAPQAAQRMKLAPAQKFYEAFNGVIDHSWQSVKYGNASRQKFMSEAMKQNGGPYVVKGYSTLVPGTYLVSDGSLPEINCRFLEFEDVETTLFYSEGPVSTERAGFYETLLSLNPYLQQGDKLTILTLRRYDGNTFTAVNYQIILRPSLEAGEKDDFETLSPLMSGKIGKRNLLFDILSGPFHTEYYETVAFALIISRGTDQSNDARSQARMAVNDEIYQQFYSESAYKLALASYQEQQTASLGAEWYLNNFPAGTIGRVVLKSIVIESQTFNVLALVISEAGINETFILADDARRPIFYNGQNADIQIPDGISTLPWDPVYLNLFSGYDYDQNTAFAQAVRILGLDGLHFTSVQFTRTEGGGTESGDILCLSNRDISKILCITCKYSDGYTENGGAGPKLTAGYYTEPEEPGATILRSLFTTYVGKATETFTILVQPGVNKGNLEIDTSLLGLPMEWNP